MKSRAPTSIPVRCLVALTFVAIWCGNIALGADATRSTKLAKAIRNLSPRVLSKEQQEDAASMVRQDVGRRIQAANKASSAAWYKIRSREDWEQFRDARLAELKRSLGIFPQPPDKLNPRVTGSHRGEGFVIDNVVFESRPGCFVTANLYRPEKSGKAMPGIVICHSHHRPKEHSELQDMGMTWARGGCVVLVIDLIGHGERRQHPFRGRDDYAKDYRWWRQDYYFRYDNGIQLHLVGESLIGWVVWDLLRSVDVLEARPDVDPKRIMLLGAVAGGGDPVAVAAALDRRIAAAVPFNFGGPQPESPQPLPEDAEQTLNYAGSGSWESTRNLRLSCQQGFLPWTIVGGIAPRKLIYAHEFRWDRERDPVWKRLTQIYSFYDAPDSLGWVKGHGAVTQSPSVATHCTHIGRVHRTMIHPLFQNWFDIPVTTDDEYSSSMDASKLECLTSEAEKELKPISLNALLHDLSSDRIAESRRRRNGLSQIERRFQLRSQWSELLGVVEPQNAPKIVGRGLAPPREAAIDEDPKRETADGEAASRTARGQLSGRTSVERIVLEVEPGILIPLILLTPKESTGGRVPIVLAVAQTGKRGFLSHRGADIGALVEAGVAVCLPDVRGTGETRSGDGRGKQTADTALSSSELMLGGTMVGARLRDLRAVLTYLRGRHDIDATELFLWGDSFASVNDTLTDFKVPHRVDGRPHQPEPLGGMLALLGALFEDDVKAVYVRGGLIGFQSVLESPLVYVPHDVVIPGVLTTGDLSDLAAATAPRPLRLTGIVDGLNRLVPLDDVRRRYEPTSQSYRRAGVVEQFSISNESAPAEWLLDHSPEKRECDR